MKRNITIAAALALSAACAMGQEALTLEDCRTLAAENNAKVRMAEGSVSAAEEVSKEAFTNYFPQVGATWLGYRANKGALQYTLPTIGELLPPGVGSMLPPELAGVANQSLGTIELLKKGWVGSVMAVQPVFMGGRIVNGNKLAHVGEEVARLQKEKAVDEVLTTVEDYYWQIMILQSKKRTLETVMSMVDTLKAQVGVAVKAGVAMRNDLLKVELRYNELRTLMVDLDNGIALSTNLLAQYIGKDGDKITVTGGEAPEELPGMPLGIYMEPGQAVGNTADSRLLASQVKAMDLKKKMAVGENLPEVGVAAGWMYDDLLNQKHNFAAVAVTVNVPLTGWWGGSHKIKKAKIEAENARIEQENLNQMIEIGMQNAWDNLTASHRKMQIAYESIGQSTENLRLNENYYRAGTSTITNLLDAQTLYRQSQDEYSEAYGKFQIEKARYLQATGQTRLGNGE